MQKLKRIQKILMLLLMHSLLFSDLFALSPKNTVLRMQYLIMLVVYDPDVEGPEAGRDTVFRYFSYYPNGALRSIRDSAVSDWRLTYSAEYDSTGKIRRLNEYRPELLYSIDYTWETDNRIKYTKQKSDTGVKDSGTIKYYGELRAVDLPENNPLAPENFLIVRADSTQYLDSEGNIITTWYWEYDSLGRCIRWRSSTPKKKNQWVEEYTYGSLGGLPARYPALEGEIVVSVYEEITGVSDYDNLFSGNKVHRKRAMSSGQFMLNGRKVRSVTTCPERELKSSLVVITQKEGKTRIVLPKSK